MAVFTCRFDSKALGFGTAFRMILPIPFVDGKKYQEHYDEYGIAVVMPDAQNGSYANMAYGPDWFTYLSEEFMEFVYQRFPVSRERKDNFISGMSMGGLGTFKMALRFPVSRERKDNFISGMSMGGLGTFKMALRLFTMIRIRENSLEGSLRKYSDILRIRRS